MPLVPTPKNCDPSVKKAVQILTQKLGLKSTPIHAGLTLTGLTASRLIWGDANKALASKDLVDLVAGTANEIDIADDGTGGVIIGIVNPLIVGKGGTGAATLTDHGILLGSGTSAITPLGVASNGQLPIGGAGADPVLANISGTTDHISVANGAGSITLNLDTNTQTLLGSFNGIFLEKLDFTISVADSTVTGSLEQDGGGDLIQRFSDGYTTLDCIPPLTINLTAYVGTDAVPKEVFVYILQTDKTTLVASNVDWPLDPEVEHIKIAHLVLKSAATTGTDGGALMNQNHNDYAFDATGEGHLQDIEHRLRQEPAQYHSGVALTLKNSGGTELTTGNSSTAVELVSATGHVFQIHQHNFPAFDMFTVATDKADIVNQPTDRGGAYKTTVDLVTDITHYVDGTAAGVAIGTNKYFNLVIWGVMNRAGETSFLMINLPTGQYTTSGNAVADVDGTSVFEIPSAFKGVGFLIARLTFRYLVSGPQWTYVAQEDLRGKFPDIIAGVGITTTDHALLANLTAPADDHTQYLLIDGTRAMTGNLIMPDGGTIGQAAGPLLTFDDTNNFLEITGCKVGIGTTSPQSALHVLGTSSATASIGLERHSANASGPYQDFIKGRASGASANVNDVTGGPRFKFYNDVPALFTGGVIQGRIKNVTDGSEALDLEFQTATSGGSLGIRMRIGAAGGLFIKEQAAASGDTANYGQIWVKDDVPNTLWFTDDTGVDYQLGGGFSSRCSVYPDSDQSISSGAITKIRFDAEIYDNDGEFDSTTNYRFTATAAGYYHINLLASMNGIVEGKNFSVRIYKNGAVDLITFTKTSLGGGIQALICSTDIYLAATDYIEGYVENGDTVARDLDGNILTTRLTIHRFA